MCACIREQVLDCVLLPKLSMSSEVELVMGITVLTLNLLIVSHKKLTLGQYSYISSSC